MASLVREMKREVIDWAKEMGWVVEERNHRYILRHPKLTEADKIFVSMQPQSPSAIPASRRQISKAMEALVVPPKKPEAAAPSAPPPPSPPAEQPTKQPPEEKVMAVSEQTNEDLIIRNFRDDVMRTGNANFDRLEIGKTVWSPQRRNEYTITGKEPFKKIVYVVDKKKPDVEIRMTSTEWNNFYISHPLEKFTVGKWLWDHQIHKWQVRKMNHTDYSVEMEDQLGVKRTFLAHEIDNLRTSISGANAVRDRMIARGEEVPPVCNLATAKPFADKLAPLKSEPPKLSVVPPNDPGQAVDYEEKWRKKPEPSELPAGFIEHDLLLRPGMKVNVKLPEDFNLKDSARLCRLIEALAFD